MARIQRGICHLCREQAELADSHVFPEFFYEDTYDESHRFISVSNHPRHRPRPMQRGLTEPLLCSACENRLSRFESYAATLLQRCDSAAEGASGGIALADVGFSTFRLFGLSLLWRAHIAKGHMFGTVNLGPLAARLRDMIWREDAGDPHQYGFALAKVIGLETHGSTMVGPAASRYLGHRAYHFMARGYEWAFVASSAAAQLQSRFPFVGSHATLYIPFMARDTRELFSSIREAFPRSFEARK